MAWRTLAILVLLIGLCSSVSSEAAMANFGELTASERVLEQPLYLQPDTTYEVSISIRTDIPDTVATLSVELFNRQGQRMGFWRTYRGLGDKGNWQRIGLEITTPADDGFTAKLVVNAAQSGRYWWDNLEIITLDKSFDGVRSFWETKFATYGTVYTGLIIDARGSNLERGMSPRIYSESGQLIYAGVTADMEFIQRRGIVSYGREFTPNLYPRIQADPTYPYALPLVIALKEVAPGPLPTNVIISDEDAKQVLEALVAYDFLARFSVVFLID